MITLKFAGDIFDNIRINQAYHVNQSRFYEIEYSKIDLLFLVINNVRVFFWVAPDPYLPSINL